MNLESKRFTFNIQAQKQINPPDTLFLSHPNGLLNPLEKNIHRNFLFLQSPDFSGRC